MHKDYFITWSQQKNADTVAITKMYKHYFLSNNKKIFDFSSLSFQASFGLKNPQLTKALTSQSHQFPIASPKHTFKLKDDVSSKLLAKLEMKGKVFYTVSGAEGIENAIKIARDTSGKNVIATRKNSYHGATLGALSCTGDWRNEAVYSLQDDILRIPEPADDPNGQKTLQLIKTFGPQKIAAFCLETITGGNGVIIANKSWWKAIQNICQKYDIYLILDEVVCGFHRTGPFCGFQHYKFLKPDFVVLAKAMTGGFFPLGAVFVIQKIAKHYDYHILPCGLTNYAHPLGLSVLNQVIHYLEIPSFQQNLDQLIFLFHALLMKQEDNRFIKSIRKIGMMAAIDLKMSIPFSYFIQRGFYLFVKNKTIILMPHLNTPQSILKNEFNKLIKVINSYE